MPNIEVHGLGVLVNGGAVATCEEIKKIFADWPCSPDIIVDVIEGSHPRDLQGNSQPYFRVWDTDSTRGKQVALRLRLHGYDVEFVALDKFLPKPLYSLDEIGQYLRDTAYAAHAYDMAMAYLLSGDAKPALKIVRGALTLYSNDRKPTEEELARRVDPVSTSRDRLVRHTQMLAILGG